MGKLFRTHLIWIAFILIFSAVSVNVSAESLDFSIPPSVEVEENFDVTVYYEDALEENICNALCVIDLEDSGTFFMDENPDCSYTDEITAPHTPGTKTMNITCSAFGYITRTVIIPIEIDEKHASVTLSLFPLRPQSGESYTVRALYRTSDYDYIFGTCKGKLKKDGIIVDYFTFTSDYATDYEKKLYPTEEGLHTIEASCTSSEFETATDSILFTVSKKSAFLDTKIQSIHRRYGDTITLSATYNSAENTRISNANCIASTGDYDYLMEMIAADHIAYIPIPFKKDNMTISIECTSDSYDSKTVSIRFAPKNRDSVIKIMSPTDRDHYPNEDVNLVIVHTDRDTNEFIGSSSCTAQVDGNDYTLKEGQMHYETSLAENSLGTHSIIVKCQKDFYSFVSLDSSYSIVKIPIEVAISPMKSDYAPGEDIVITASVSDPTESDVNIECTMRVDRHDLSFNRLIDTSVIPLVKAGDFYSASLEENKESANIDVTVTCGSDIHEPESSWTNLRINVLGKQTKDSMIIVLGTATLILLALVILIRRKLKIL